MDIQLLSTTYEVSKLGEQDIPTIFELYRGNPLYFHHCPPPASPEGVREDMTMLPEGKTADDKYYIGFWKEKELVAVMDLVLGYPDEKTAYIGLFMVNAEYQGKGIGSIIIEEVCACLKETFSYARLGYVNGNRQSESFWRKNGFSPTGVRAQRKKYEVIVAQRTLQKETEK